MNLINFYRTRHLNSYRFRILVPKVGACHESYFWLHPASVKRRAVIRAGERCVLQCRHCNAAIGILNYQPLWNPMPKAVYSVGWL